VAAAALARLGPQPARQAWGWLALAAQTRPSMAWHGGDRRHTRAEPLGATMPPASRPPAPCDPDHEGVEGKGRPAAPHHALSPVARPTHHRARVTPTRRPRVARLAREAWSGSNKLAHPLGALMRLLCHSHLTSAAA
jgi:hypothetical protein